MPPKQCASIFPACGDLLEAESCLLDFATDASQFPQCDGSLKSTVADFKQKSDAQDNQGMLEFILGGLAGGGLRKATCLTAMRYLHTTTQTMEGQPTCPMPLPPLQKDIIATSGSFNLMTVGDWGPTKEGVNCKCAATGTCSASMWTYTQPACPGSQQDPTWVRWEGAHQNVANAMAAYAQANPPSAVINVGDNFYFGGLAPPGTPADGYTASDADFTFEESWRKVYLLNEKDTGKKMGVPWLSVLGNHDYGGAGCLADWQAQVDFTEQDPADAWRMPYQYFQQRVQADGYFVDIFLNEVNWDDAGRQDSHGICHQQFCGHTRGDEANCKTRFDRTKDANLAWLDKALGQSAAEGARWQIVVGHFSHESNADLVQKMMMKHNSSLYVGGHTHGQIYQSVNKIPDYKGGFVEGPPVLVTGAGGGIGLDGSGPFFGFGNVKVSPDELVVDLLDDTGALRESNKIRHPSLLESELVV